MLLRRILTPTSLPPLLLLRSLPRPRHRHLHTSPHPPPPANASPQALLAHFSQTPNRALTLKDLTRFGAPPLGEKELLQSAEDTRQALLVGLARRVTAHLSLPFLPATNPSLQSIHQLYLSAFTSLCSVPEIKTLHDNDLLCHALRDMVEQHRDNIPILAKGFQETRRYLPDSVITSFLDRAIRNRITLRLLAEHHLSLSSASLATLTPSAIPSSPSPSPSPKDPRVEPSARPPSNSLAPSRVGVLDLALSPNALIDSCAKYVSDLCEATYGVAPKYRIEGATEATIGGIGVHLEYVMTELLKNAFRATIESNTPKKEEPDPGVFRFEDLPSAHMSPEDFPEIVVTIAVAPGILTIRVRDRGGGIKPENLPNVWSYAFTTVPPMPDPDADPDSPGSDLYGGASGAGYYGGVGGGPGGGDTVLKTGMGTLAGLGFGLPLSRIYSQYFGGSLDLVTMYGWGTDTYCVFRTV